MPDKKTKTQMLMQTVSKELSIINSQSGEGKRLASLYRHNVDKVQGENPELFGRIIQNLPEDLRGNGFAEQTVYTALTLAAFAGNNGEATLGEAISRIEHNENLIKRFRSAETAKDISELRYKLRRVLKIISSKGQTVNYTILAAELYNWQYSKAAQIRKWERELIK